MVLTTDTGIRAARSTGVLLPLTLILTLPPTLILTLLLTLTIPTSNPDANINHPQIPESEPPDRRGTGTGPGAVSNPATEITGNYSLPHNPLQPYSPLLSPLICPSSLPLLSPLNRPSSFCQSFYTRLPSLSTN